jgi:hypothetical protein
MKKTALDRLNDSKQNPLPEQSHNESWNSDQDLMEWLNNLGK